MLNKIAIVEGDHEILIVGVGDVSIKACARRHKVEESLIKFITLQQYNALKAKDVSTNGLIKDFIKIHELENFLS